MALTPQQLEELQYQLQGGPKSQDQYLQELEEKKKSKLRVLPSVPMNDMTPAPLPGYKTTGATDTGVTQTLDTNAAGVPNLPQPPQVTAPMELPQTNWDAQALPKVVMPPEQPAPQPVVQPAPQPQPVVQPTPEPVEPTEPVEEEEVDDSNERAKEAFNKFGDIALRIIGGIGDVSKGTPGRTTQSFAQIEADSRKSEADKMKLDQAKQLAKQMERDARLAEDPESPLSKVMQMYATKMLGRDDFDGVPFAEMSAKDLNVIIPPLQEMVTYDMAQNEAAFRQLQAEQNAYDKRMEDQNAITVPGTEFTGDYKPTPADAKIVRKLMEPYTAIQAQYKDLTDARDAAGLDRIVPGIVGGDKDELEAKLGLLRAHIVNSLSGAGVSDAERKMYMDMIPEQNRVLNWAAEGKLDSFMQSYNANMGGKIIPYGYKPIVLGSFKMLGPDGRQTFTIPASEVDEAIANGYTRK